MKEKAKKTKKTKNPTLEQAAQQFYARWFRNLVRSGDVSVKFFQDAGKLRMWEDKEKARIRAKSYLVDEAGIKARKRRLDRERKKREKESTEKQVEAGVFVVGC